jgi:hypothetical protein
MARNLNFQERNRSTNSHNVRSRTTDTDKFKRSNLKEEENISYRISLEHSLKFIRSIFHIHTQTHTNTLAIYSTKLNL